ncbi:MAG TPA: hypothetical protein VGR89_10135 [Puia sp.]|nr:hypothetical protein [Puia sp.]
MSGHRPWSKVKEDRKRADFWETPEYHTAVKRVQKMGSTEILEYLDQAGTGMESILSNYRRDGEINWLLELMPHVSVIQAALEELIVRDQSS